MTTRLQQKFLTNFLPKPYLMIVRTSSICPVDVVILNHVACIFGHFFQRYFSSKLTWAFFFMSKSFLRFFDFRVCLQGQLFKLMKQLESSTPHFIRCIKPNSKKIPGLYEKDLVLEQLRCCGVLEIVRISRSGYPTRVTHQEFARRWSVILWFCFLKTQMPGNNVFE